MAEKKQCAGEAHGTGRFGWLHRYACEKSATLEHEGKWYCKIHHPPSVRARADKRTAEYRERLRADMERSRQRADAAAERDRKARAYDAVAELLAEIKGAPVHAGDDDIYILASEIEAAMATK